MKQNVSPDDIISHFENDMVKIRSELERDMENALDEWRKRVSRRKMEEDLGKADLLSVADDEEEDRIVATDDIVIGGTDESEGDVIDRVVVTGRTTMGGNRVGVAGSTTTTTVDASLTADNRCDPSFERRDEDVVDSSRGENEGTLQKKKRKKKKKKKKRKKKPVVVENAPVSSGASEAPSRDIVESVGVEQLREEQRVPSTMGYMRGLVVQFALLAVVAGQLIFQFFI